MKNYSKLFGIIALAAMVALAFTGCSDGSSGSSGGSLTITNLGSFNGCYVVAKGGAGPTNGYGACQSVTLVPEVIMVGRKVSGGSVTLPVKRVIGTSITPYSGDATVSFEVHAKLLDSVFLESAGDLDMGTKIGEVMVTFVDGIAEGALVP